MSETRTAEIEHLREQVELKDKMLEESNDQIICLKSKVHGLRTIIIELRNVEKKYKVLLSKSQISTGKATGYF